MNENINLLEQISLRTNENGEEVIDGYSAVFEQLSRRIIEGGKVFFEIIHTGSFDECDFTNVIMCTNHNKQEMLARSKSNTLLLNIDDKGLKYTFSVPNTTRGNDVKEQVKRGDFYESSFAFVEDKSKTRWSRDEEGNLIKHIYSIKRVTDCAIVLNGAYEHTNISLRELQEIEESLDEVKVDEYQRDFQRELQLIKLKNK